MIFIGRASSASELLRSYIAVYRLPGMRAKDLRMAFQIECGWPLMISDRSSFPIPTSSSMLRVLQPKVVNVKACK
jgi:hypothetical protein